MRQKADETGEVEDDLDETKRRSARFIDVGNRAYEMLIHGFEEFIPSGFLHTVPLSIT